MFRATGSCVFVMTVQQIRRHSKDTKSGSCTPDLHRPQNHENNITLDVISDRVPGPMNVFAGVKSSSMHFNPKVRNILITSYMLLGGTLI